ncbi:hypothetical protein [Mycolicibacterium stellerae]|uniref:hypothetical protein n=1 Tax=Mycolicibacterium stellerae TaxID=2358193 RepID=UPI000F0AF91B|nr:hypothetical protein [Mycolicibacterium stellerae]
MYSATDDLRRSGPDAREGVRDAVRFSVGVAVAAAVFLAVAAVWAGTCGGSTFDAVACGAPQLTLFAIGAPLILLGGGLWAFLRTFQARRQDAVAWPWHAAGWVLMAVMLLVFATSVPSIAMPYW